ncbi:hypothetical protein FZEAL_192 [Fusarium zealandicum]|uniref:Uncharacterized protein n=1 Tax=Fusarium zealandicum TaxID=1053134 RepID=A0A8H4XQJ4_9HYPO|nr:hypothetical protein FZEAL_192 [Fusarium zealandicum]
MAQHPAHASSHDAPMADLDDQPTIPHIGGLSSTLFVPISDADSLQDPGTGGTITKAQLLQKRLEALEHHALASRNNFLTLCVHEREHILQSNRCQTVQEQRAGAVPMEILPGVEQQELDFMISNMEAEPSPHQGPGFVVNERPLLDPSKSRNLRENLALRLMQFADFAAEASEEREADFARRRAYLEDELRKEQAREEQQRRAG